MKKLFNHKSIAFQDRENLCQNQLIPIRQLFIEETLNRVKEMIDRKVWAIDNSSFYCSLAPEDERVKEPELDI